MSKTSDFIREKREALGMSQEELAEKTGVFVSEVRLWESGMLPDSKHLLQLAEALQVGTDEILRGEEEPSESVSEGLPRQEIVSDGHEPEQALSDRQENLVKEESENPQTEQEAAQEDEKESADETEKYSFLSEQEEDEDDFEPIPEDFDESLRRNGFTKKERVWAYVAGTLFILIVLVNLISSGVAYLNRDRTLAMENYKNYIEIDSDPVGNVNVDTVEITVKFKAHVTDFDLTLAVSFSPMLVGNEAYTTEISFSQRDCQKGEVLSRQITYGEYYEYSPFAHIQVNSVSGGLD